MPSFSVHDMKGGEVGGVIPASASAQIEVRLVKDNDPKAMLERITAFIRSQGYFVTDKDPDVATLASHARVAKVVRGARNGGAWRTEPGDPQAAFATEALKSAWGDRLVRLRTFGGSVPATPFIDAFKIPTIGIAIANYDDNQHTDNENIRIGNIFDGMISLAALMMH
jgi:acetylornithine deacetylase/succinyl-diaminopimelate desuccinylase-like protein